MNRPPRTKREYLQQLVSEKNRWSRPLTDEEKALGFLGWHERGYLPHCDYPGLIQFVTFRLADSMPASRRAEWEHLLSIEDVREKRTKLEDYRKQSGEGKLVSRTATLAIQQWTVSGAENTQIDFTENRVASGMMKDGGRAERDFGVPVV